ncbi:MAG: DUF4893 domain-containing protein [Rhizobiaceae bacterium]|nr:DUF4893 domain-containing protein [Rhizobiaceae bacterium]
MRRYLPALVALILPATANATGAIVDLITPADERRLERFDEARAKALSEARAGGSAADLTVLEDLVGREHQPWADFDLTGDWQCRTVKVGGIATLVVYGWFKCRVSDDGSGWKLEKLSGSQRTTGRFFTESDTAAIYLGVYHVAGTATPDYGKGPESDQVGRTFRTGKATWQIEFPLPTYESTFDILEFRK